QTAPQAEAIEQALIIGQAIAEQRQSVAIFTEASISTAIIRGSRTKSGVVIGFTIVKNREQVDLGQSMTGIDTVIYAGSTPARQRLFCESLDALLVQAYPESKIQLTLPLPNTIPVGVLIHDRQSTQQIAHIVELAQ